MPILVMAMLGVSPIPLAPAQQQFAYERRVATLETGSGDTIKVEMRQIGHTLPNRPGSARCIWRTIVPASGAADQNRLIEGSRPGVCEASTAAIKAEVASKAERIALNGGVSDRAE